MEQKTSRLVGSSLIGSYFKIGTTRMYVAIKKWVVKVKLGLEGTVLSFLSL